MKLSVILVTRDRAEVLRATLDGLLEAVDLPRGWWEVIVVDNGSRDGSAGVAAEHPLGVRVIRRARDEGPAAANHGFGVAAGEAWLWLDDDCLPEVGTVGAGLGVLERSLDVGAVCGVVQGLDGTRGGSELPAVMMDPGVMLRAEAVREVGGLPWDFGGCLEGFDLAMRLWRGGWRVERYEDLGYVKRSGVVEAIGATRCGLRNRLVMADRYLPLRLAAVYRADWLQRYTLLARHYGGALGWLGAWRGWVEGRLAGGGYDGRLVLGREALEAVFGFDRIAEAVAAWSATHRVRRVALGCLAENTFAAYRACQLLGLDLVGVLDESEAFAGRVYRGLPVVRSAAELGRPLDGVVLSELNPARVASASAGLRDRTGLPVLRLWEPRFVEEERVESARGMGVMRGVRPERGVAAGDLRAA